MDDEQWEAVLEYVIGRLEEEASFEIGDLEFARLFYLPRGYYASLLERIDSKTPPCFGASSAWKDSLGDPAGPITFRRIVA